MLDGRLENVSAGGLAVGSLDRVQAAQAVDAVGTDERPSDGRGASRARLAAHRRRGTDAHGARVVRRRREGPGTGFTGRVDSETGSSGKQGERQGGLQAEKATEQPTKRRVRLMGLCGG